MRRLQLILLACLFVTGCQPKAESNKSADTQLAVTTVLDQDELNIPVVDFEGLEPLLNPEDDTTYILNFWATWCAPCIKELPYFEDVQRELGTDGVQVILVNLDMPKMWESHLIPFIQKNELKSRTIVLDDPDQNTWIPKVHPDWSGAIPATLLIDKTNREFYEKPFTRDELFQTIKKFKNFAP